MLYIVWCLYMFSGPHSTVTHVFFLYLSASMGERKMHIHKFKLKNFPCGLRLHKLHRWRPRKFNHRFDKCILLVETLPGAYYEWKFLPSFIQPYCSACYEICNDIYKTINPRYSETNRKFSWDDDDVNKFSMNLSREFFCEAPKA